MPFCSETLFGRDKPKLEPAGRGKAFDIMAPEPALLAVEHIVVVRENKEIMAHLGASFFRKGVDAHLFFVLFQDAVDSKRVHEPRSSPCGCRFGMMNESLYPSDFRLSYNKRDCFQLFVGNKDKFSYNFVRFIVIVSKISFILLKICLSAAKLFVVGARV